MSIQIETAGRPRTRLLAGAAAAFLSIAAVSAYGPAAAQNVNALFDDPMESLIGAQETPQTAPAAAQSETPLRAVPVQNGAAQTGTPAATPFQPSPETRFQNRVATPQAPQAPAVQDQAPAAGTLGFSAEPTRLDAQRIAEAGARGDQMVQGAAQRWGLSAATLYMLGALLGLLGLLLLARLFGLGQSQPKAQAVRAKRKAAPAARRTAQAPADDWEEDEEPSERFAVAARRAVARGGESVRGVTRRAAPEPVQDDDWAEAPAQEAAPRRAPRQAPAREAFVEEAAPAPRRPNLDRLAASIRETWPKGVSEAEAAVESVASPARAAAARVAREFVEQPEEIPPQPRRTRPAARRGEGDFLDALEAAGEGDPSALDRVRGLGRAR